MAVETVTVALMRLALVVQAAPLSLVGIILSRLSVIPLVHRYQGQLPS